LPRAAAEIVSFEFTDASAFNAPAFFLAFVASRVCKMGPVGDQSAEQRGPRALQVLSGRLLSAIKALPRLEPGESDLQYSGIHSWNLSSTSLLPGQALLGILALMRQPDSLTLSHFDSSLHFFTSLYPDILYELQRSSSAPKEALKSINRAISKPFEQYRSRITDAIQDICRDFLSCVEPEATAKVREALGDLSATEAWGRAGSAQYLPFHSVKKGAAAVELPTAGVLDVSLYHPKYPLFCRRFIVLEDSQTIPLMFQVLGALSMTVPSLIGLVGKELDLASCDIRTTEAADKKLAEKLPTLKSVLHKMLSEALLPATDENLREALQLAIRLTSGALKVHVEPVSLWFDSPEARRSDTDPVLYQVRVALQVRVMASADTAYTAVLTHGDTLLAAGGSTINLTSGMCRDGLEATEGATSAETIAARSPGSSQAPPARVAPPVRSIIHYGSGPDFVFSKAEGRADGAQKNIRVDFRFYFVFRALGKLLCFPCPIQPIQGMLDFIAPSSLDCQAPGLRRFLLKLAQNPRLLQAAASEAGIGAPPARPVAALGSPHPVSTVDPVTRASLLASLMAAPKPGRRAQQKAVESRGVQQTMPGSHPPEDRGGALKTLQEAVESVGAPVEAALRPFEAQRSHFLYCDRKDKLGDIFGQYFYGQFSRELGEFTTRVSAQVVSISSVLFGFSATDGSKEELRSSLQKLFAEAGFCIELCPSASTAARDLATIYSKYSVQFDTLAYPREVSLCDGDSLPQFLLRLSRSALEELGRKGPSQQTIAVPDDAEVRIAEMLKAKSLCPQEPARILHTLQQAALLVRRYKPLLKPIPAAAMKSKVAEAIGDEVFSPTALWASAILARLAQLLNEQAVSCDVVGLYPSDLKKAREYQALALSGRGTGNLMIAVTISGSLPSSLSLAFLAGLKRAVLALPRVIGEGITDSHQSNARRVLVRECRTSEDISDLAKLFESSTLSDAVIIIYAGEVGPKTTKNLLWLQSSSLNSGFEGFAHVCLSEGLRARVLLPGAEPVASGSDLPVADSAGQTQFSSSTSPASLTSPASRFSLQSLSSLSSLSPLLPVPLVEGIVPGVTTHLFTFLGPLVRKQTPLEIPGVTVESIPLNSISLSTYADGITAVTGRTSQFIGSAERDVSLISVVPLVLQDVCSALAESLCAATGLTERRTILSSFGLDGLVSLSEAYQRFFRATSAGTMLRLQPEALPSPHILCSDATVFDAHNTELSSPDSLPKITRWLHEKPLAKSLTERLHSSLLRLQERSSCQALRVLLDFGGLFSVELSRQDDGRSSCVVSVGPGVSAAIADKRLTQLRAAAGEGSAIRTFLCGSGSDRRWPGLSSSLRAANGELAALPAELSRPLALLTTCVRNLMQSIVLELVHLSEAEAARMEGERSEAPELNTAPRTDEEIYSLALKKYEAEPLPKGWFYDGFYYLTLDGDRTTERPDKARLISRYRKEMGL